MNECIRMEEPSIFEKEFNKWAIKTDDFSKIFAERKKIDGVDFPEFDTPDSSEYRKHWLFKNGMRISVIRGYGTYGAREGLFECVVIDKNGIDSKIETASNVVGWLTSEEVLELGKRIKNLKR